jgi:hypothetical protein
MCCIASSHSLVHYFLLSDIDRNYYINLHGNAGNVWSRAKYVYVCKGYYTHAFMQLGVLPHLLAAHIYIHRAAHLVRKVLLPHRRRCVPCTLLLPRARCILFSNNDPIASRLEILHLITQMKLLCRSRRNV